MKTLLVFSFLSVTALAEVHTMTLRQALDTALAQNPDVVLARLDQQRAQQQVGVVRDPFTVKSGIGSGLAGTYGFPASMNGNAPSIIQNRGEMALFDRPQTWRVRQAREAARGSAIDVDLRQEEVAYNVYTAFLDAEQAGRSATAGEQQLANLRRVEDLVGVRVSQGQELPITSREASLNTRQAEVTLGNFRRTQTDAEITLAQLLGLPPGDQVRPALEERPALLIAPNEQDAIAGALADSKELRRLESNVTAKRLEIKSYKAERLPKINALWTYQLLSRYNNFDVFYPRFQRHNFQGGVSIELPIFVGSAAGASMAQADIDIQKLEVQMQQTRTRISADVRRAYSDVERAEAERDLARERLDVARERVNLDLVQYDAGRIPMSQVESDRADEQQQWVSYYDAQRAVETARLNVLRGTGTLLTALQ